MEPFRLTISQAARLLAEGKLTSCELTGSILSRIDDVEPKVDAFLSIFRDRAMQEAELCDQALKSGGGGPLCGVPISVKDVLCTKGLRTTCGSKILENFIPPYDATVVQKLRDAGAVIVGKNNMDEFAMGSSTENSAYKPTKNPWDLSRIPGGSSGGSAAAVAADMGLGSVGSDTGGSIRQPASHCGVVGLKPSYGRVSRYGLVAYASSLDQVGPLTKTVEDAALLMNVLAGHDHKDSTSMPKPVPDYTEALGRDVKGLVLGLPGEYFNSEGLEPDVSRCVYKAVKTLEGLGAEVVSVSLPHTEYAVAAYYLIATAEASSNLARYDGVKYGFRDPDPSNLLEMYTNTRSKGFGPEVRRRIILGTYALSSGYYDAYYGKASAVRTLIMRDFARAFAACDAIVAPVCPTPAFLMGEKCSDPLTMYLSDIFTVPANLAGLPGISVPCGFSEGGLPIGLQIMADQFAEETILTVAQHLEKALNVYQQKPAL
ncbi:MAG: Asp-tRNA(Asn)/Glu-tRNA(Gln) amidotransferase subunit GatA [Deltaproteobacteria bacterium]|nr:Asp-tRNA(Asn)/Glu-tRNA(Gln) amidotransferase subunit GatA [Deltaproteobacteria bacterium]